MSTIPTTEIVSRKDPTKKWIINSADVLDSDTLWADREKAKPQVAVEPLPPPEPPASEAPDATEASDTSDSEASAGSMRSTRRSKRG